MKMVLGILACLVTSSSTAASGQAFDRSAWLQDYTTLKGALEKRYSNLAWFASPEGGVDLPAVDRRTLAALQAAGSDDDARSALLSFVRSFRDGHFSQLPTLEPAPATTAAPPGTFEFTPQDAAGGCAALSYAPYDRAQFSLPFESLPGFHLLADGIGTPFRAGILTGGDPQVRLGIVRIPSFEEASDVGLCMKAWTRSDVWDAQGKFVRGALRRAVERSWYASLADVLATFKAGGAAAVLVDIGNNSGGDDSGDIAARLFTTTPLRSAPLWMSQDLASSGPYFEEELTALHTAQQRDSTNRVVEQALSAFVHNKTALTENVCQMQWVWQTRRAWSSNTCRRLVEAGSAGGPLAYLAITSTTDTVVAMQLHWPTTSAPFWGAWTGPLYVLTDNRTYSAAEMFAAVLQNNRAAKIVGGATGGDGCGFMNNPGPVVLPHSRLRFRVPNCVRVRADGTDEVAGVKPDIPVLPTDGEGGRPRARRVFDSVRADLSRAAQP